MLIEKLFKLYVVACTLALSGCGGGGGGSTNTSSTQPSQTTNAAPTANAGADQTVSLGDTVNLNASNSSDPNNDTLTYSWSLDVAPANSQSALTNTSSEQTSFEPDIAGQYTVGLIVNDGALNSSKDTVVITVNSNENTAPIANAGNNKTVAINSTVILSGSNSSDPEGDPLTYQWTLESKPQNSQTVLNNNTSESSNFVPDEQGSYTIGLVVNDGELDSVKATVIITAQNDVSNTPPIADAGGDRNVDVGQPSELSGENSSDPDGDNLSYSWTIEAKPQDSLMTLIEDNIESISVTPDMNGTFTFGLVVNDGIEDSAKVTVTLTAQANNLDITDAIFLNRAGSCEQYLGTYTSNVTDIQQNAAFNGQVEIVSSGTQCTINVNQIPNHDFNDNSARFATDVAVVVDSFQIPAMPAFANSDSSLALGTTEGIFLNGVTLDILAAACYGVGSEPLGEEKIGCGPDNNDNPWRYDPMSPLNTFGTDAHNAHTQPTGKYHYHANPVAMFEQSCGETASAAIGFAADGFPIYGACFKDPDTGEVRKAQPSYALKDNGGPRQDVTGYQTPQAGVGVVASGNYDGQFRGDWEFIANSGDLDQCNGMTINGQYGYYVTDSFPWVINCFKGSTDSSFSAGPQLQRRSHSHDDITTHSHGGNSHSH